MKLAPVLLLLALSGARRPQLLSHATVSAPADVPPAVAAVLANIKRADTRKYAVSEEDGRFLRVLARTGGARRALEIGGASGYSAIWIGLALQETGGELVTIEYDAERAREAKANIERAGLTSIVRVVSGDAFAEIPKTRRHVRLRLSRRVEARLPQVLRPDLPAPVGRAASSSRTMSSTSATK